MRRFEPLIERGLFLCALLSVGTTVGIIGGSNSQASAAVYHCTSATDTPVRLTSAATAAPT